MVNIGNGARLSVVDNSGVKKLKNILVYGRRPGFSGDLGIGSLAVVKPRRKLKKGSLVRFLLIQSRRIASRPMGSYIRSVAFRAILLKRTEFEPLANRLNGFFFLDLRKYEEFRSTGMTVYIILLPLTWPIWLSITLTHSTLTLSLPLFSFPIWLRRIRFWRFAHLGHLLVRLLFVLKVLFSFFLSFLARLLGLILLGLFLFLIKFFLLNQKSEGVRVETLKFTQTCH